MATELKKMQMRRARDGLKPCDTNFVEKNIEQSRDVLDQLRVRKQVMDELRAERTEEAKDKREEFRQERIEKISFDMEKWNMYRVRVDQIDEKWHEFKKRQMKILWWNCLIHRHFACKKAKYNFDEFLRIVIQRCREKLLIFRIGYHHGRF